MATKILGKVWLDADDDPSVTVYDTKDKEFATYAYDPGMEDFYKTTDDYGAAHVHEDYVPKKVRKLLRNAVTDFSTPYPSDETSAVAAVNYLLTLDPKAYERAKALIKYTEDNE